MTSDLIAKLEALDGPGRNPCHRTGFACPCCGTPLPGAIDPEDVPMSAVRQTIVRALPATIEQIANAVYGSRDNTPDSQYRSLQVIISQTRKMLEPHGWSIDAKKSGRGNVKTYRLVRVP